jgi:hypothetical protein
MTKKAKTTKVDSTANTRQIGVDFPRGYWLHFFLSALAVYSLYLVVMYISRTGHIPISTNIAALFDGITSSLLVVIFTVLFLVHAGLRRPMPIVATVCAYILTILAALALIATMIITSKPDYSDNDFYFAFFVLFHNPWVAIVNSVVSILGIATLVVGLVRRHKK